MATPYSSNFEGCRPFSDTGMMIILAAATEATWTVPGTSVDMWRADFAFIDSAEFWVALNKTAVVPTSGVVVATNQQEMRPKARYVRGGDVIHLIAVGTPQVGISLLKIAQ